MKLSAPALGLVLATSIVSFFTGTMLYEGEAARYRTLYEEALSAPVGTPGPCSVSIPRSVWDDMNEIGYYRWVVACEDLMQGPRL